MVKDGRVSPIHGNRAECLERFPGNARRVTHPVLIRARIAVRPLVLLDHLGIRCLELPLHPSQFLIAIDLEAQVIGADRLPWMGIAKFTRGPVVVQVGPELTIMFPQSRIRGLHQGTDPHEPGGVGLGRGLPAQKWRTRDQARQGRDAPQLCVPILFA
jgi:hypothetical protein